MLKTDLEGLKNLRCILLIMEAATDLNVNWSKSMTSPMGRISNVKGLAEVLKCDVEPLLISYLGLPLRAKLSSTAM